MKNLLLTFIFLSNQIVSLNAQTDTHQNRTSHCCEEKSDFDVSAF